MFGAVGVTVYSTTAGAAVAFVSVWAMVEPLLPLNPVAVPDNNAAVQVYVVPTIVELSATLVVPALHIDCAEAEPTDTGLTVTVAEPVAVHPLPAVAVTV